MRLSYSAIFLLTLSACSRGDSPNTNEQIQGMRRIPCTTAADCRSRGGVCTQGQCTADNECGADADCTAGEVCTLDPEFGGLCGPAGTTPFPGPAWSCTADADCPARQICDAGQCAVPATSACATDQDCPAGETCQAAQCVAGQATCASDGDCQNGEVCTQGSCVPGVACSADSDCGAREICRADRVCAPNPWACSTTADCDARTGYVCTNGECGPPDTSGCNGNNCPCDVLAQDCPNSLRCFPFGPATSDGQCYGEGAKTLGEACREPPIGGPESCVSGLVCVATDEEGSSGSCMKLCASAAGCASGEVCRAITEPSTGQTAEWGLCAAPARP